MIFALQRLLIRFFYIDRSIFILLRRYERLLYKFLFVGLIFYLLILRNSIIYNKILENTNRYIKTIEKHLIVGEVEKTSHDILNVDGLIMLYVNNY